ncbi:MAG: hypothetical protein R3222_05295 [Balneolaceae bacterium]|nr:hypothetical protein [Balneolaceae bacterium]
MFFNLRVLYASGGMAAILLLLFTSCNPSGEEEFRETYIFEATSQSSVIYESTSRQVGPDSVITVYEFSIDTGSNLVFEYGRKVHPPENITDAGLAETLVFQIPPDTDTFDISGNQLEEARAFYRRGCFCPESGAGFKATEGFIEGERLSANIWFVRADVTISTYRQDQDHKVQFEHVFRISPK